MSIQHLCDLLEEKKQELQKHYQQLAIDTEYWNEEVIGFYSKVREWLKPLAQQSLISFEQHSESSADNVGMVTTEFFTIKFFNGETIEFKDAGIRTGGAFGRIDMCFGNRYIEVILETQHGNWSLVEQKYYLEKPEVHEFTQENFEKIVTSFAKTF